ncbi:putative transporter [Burkholderiaceae bacterium]|nr:putative transporter [Burkholderiaceae bacterium]
MDSLTGGTSTTPLPPAAPDGSPRAEPARGGAPVLSRAVVLLAALASGLAVANVYYAQPLLDAIGDDLRMPRSTIGIVGTLTQIGYGLGLLALVPLGDLVDRRKLIIGQSALSVLALCAVALATHGAALLAAIFVVGFLAVVAQVHVAHAAALASPAERGRVVGAVTSGIVCGILLARAASGLLSDVFGWRAIYVAAALANIVVVALLAKALPTQPSRGQRMGYVELVTSVISLFAQERVLRIRATLALLIFMSITVLWTSMALALRAPPHELSHTAVGMFGFAGVLGAMGATLAGGRADRGQAQRTTGIALTLMLLAWIPLAAQPYSIWALIAGVVLIDFGLQAVHVSNQSLIYRVRPEAQSRLTAGYMIFYSIGCALGSILSTIAFALAGWRGVSLLGFAISALALAQWLATRRHTPG